MAKDPGNINESQSPWKVKLILCLMILLYAIGFFARSALSSIADVLEADLETTSSGVGLIASIIYVPFTLGQVPMGVLLETYQAPVILCISSFMVSISLALFAFAQNEFVAVLARILAGITVLGLFQHGLHLLHIQDKIVQQRH